MNLTNLTVTFLRKCKHLYFLNRVTPYDMRKDVSDQRKELSFRRIEISDNS